MLHHGSHSPDHKFCVMEAAAYIAGEPWSDLAPTVLVLQQSALELLDRMIAVGKVAA